VKYLQNKTGYQANVNISWRILKDTTLIKISNYNLLSPIVSDSLQHPSFIDGQRFSLDNGEYVLELIVSDNNLLQKKSTHVEKISIDFKRNKTVYNSDIQLMESYSKSKSTTIFTKNGYDLIPYCINYFPKTQNTIKFYMESYNLDTVLDKNKRFFYSYFIENSETHIKLDEFYNFQKQKAATVNPLLAQIDISKLSTGNYNLVIEVRDSLNNRLSQKKWFFQRLTDYAKPKTATDNYAVTNISDFFNMVQSSDTLKSFVECLWPISSTIERTWQQSQIKNNDAAMMRNYLIDYWKAESKDTIDPLILWFSYYKEVLEANANFKCGKQKGYYTDRGRVYLQYGKPDNRTQVNSEANTYPYEMWHYNRIYDRATKRFFSNKKFVFVNFAIADDCYKLIHSEVVGEIYDARWRYRLVSRVEETLNKDKTMPDLLKDQGTNIEDNFNNPR